MREYSQQIVDFSKESKQLPFYSKFDINNDGKDEIMLIQKLIIGGYEKLLIISENKGKLKFSRIKWRRPVNSLFFDYLIDIAKPGKYQTFEFTGQEANENLSNSMKSKIVDTNYPHLITKGYLSERN